MRISRFTAAVLLTATLSTGCYGRFALTDSFHDWNGGISNKWVRSLVFFGLVVVQAYTICLLGDGIIFNTVEFWTGDNPVASVEADGTVVVARGEQEYRLVPLEDRRFTLKLDGADVAEVELLEDGSLALVDGTNGRSMHVSKDKLAALGAPIGSVDSAVQRQP